jgi:hypothetical protein
VLLPIAQAVGAANLLLGIGVDLLVWSGVIR